MVYNQQLAISQIHPSPPDMNLLGENWKIECCKDVLTLNTETVINDRQPLGITLLIPGIPSDHLVAVRYEP